MSHKPGCPAEGGYGQGVEPCICKQAEPSDAEILAIAQNAETCPCLPQWLNDEVVVGAVQQQVIAFAREVLRRFGRDAEVERLRADAERYRWLRTPISERHTGSDEMSFLYATHDCPTDYYGSTPVAGDELDAAIDALRGSLMSSKPNSIDTSAGCVDGENMR